MIRPERSTKHDFTIKFFFLIIQITCNRLLNDYDVDVYRPQGLGLGKGIMYPFVMRYCRAAASLERDLFRPTPV